MLVELGRITHGNTMLGVISGSGLYSFGKKAEEHVMFTPYGDAVYYIAKKYGKEIVFILRHGHGHTIPPHKVNYRANVYALKSVGATAAFSTNAVGIISKYRPGDLILVEDFLGFNTPITFFEDFSSGIKHTDFTEVYNKELVGIVKRIASQHRIEIKNKGIIATTPGTRFETKTEISALKKMGANLVSMTHAYEATLLRELEIPSVCIAIGTNYACGISRTLLSASEIIKRGSEAEKKINIIIDELCMKIE